MSPDQARDGAVCLQHHAYPFVGYAHKSGTLVKPPRRGAAQDRFQRKSAKNSVVVRPLYPADNRNERAGLAGVSFGGHDSLENATKQAKYEWCSKSRSETMGG